MMPVASLASDPVVVHRDETSGPGHGDGSGAP
jgi:hypothetical protein